MAQIVTTHAHRVRPTVGEPSARRSVHGAMVAAAITWAAALPLCWQLPSWLDVDPFGQRARALVLGPALGVIGLLLAIGWRRSSPWLAGVAAGLLAAWVALALRTALHGTPYGFGGFQGDPWRISAMAERYSTTTASADAWIPGLPAEYPPLYPWLIGRASALTHIDAWRLLGPAEVLTMSAGVLVGFLLWRRLTSDWVALLVPMVSIYAWARPHKAYEVFTLVLFVPWVLGAFARPPKGRLPWWIAGILGGVLLLTYSAWLVFGAVGILAVIVMTWRAEVARREYLMHVGLVALVSAATASWYVIPFVVDLLAVGGQQASDAWLPRGGVLVSLLPFLGTSYLSLLQAIGLAGAILLRGRAWWPTPLLLLAASAFGYRVAATIGYAMTGHTSHLTYTPRLYGPVLAISGVLTMAHLVSLARARFNPLFVRGVLPVAVAIPVTVAALSLCSRWMPHGVNDAGWGHVQALPTGGYPRYAPSQDRQAWFPATQIDQVLRRTAGSDRALVTLSADERLYAFFPLPGYLSVSRNSAPTLSRWSDRRAEIVRLAGLHDPAALADAAGRTAFGPIDAFVLRRRADGWYWTDIRFSPSAFKGPRWRVSADLPAQFVVAVRS